MGRLGSHAIYYLLPVDPIFLGKTCNYLMVMLVMTVTYHLEHLPPHPLYALPSVLVTTPQVWAVGRSLNLRTNSSSRGCYVELMTIVLYVQWTLDYPDLDYPDPRLSGSRTEIIACAYNDLRMRVEQLTTAKSVVLSTEDSQVVGQGCLPLSSTVASPVDSSWLFSPC